MTDEQRAIESMSPIELALHYERGGQVPITRLPHLAKGIRQFNLENWPSLSDAELVPDTGKGAD